MDNKESNCCGNNHEHNCKNHNNHDHNCNHEDHECDCTNHKEHGCGCSGHKEYINVTFDNGEEQRCLVLSIIDVDDKDYIALLPDGEEEFFVYRYNEKLTGIVLNSISDKEELEKVGTIFENMFDDEYEDE